MMTIHSSKGLEFPNVFVVGFSEGIFPSAKTIEERKQLGLEEERRLCYVAITRAEQRLFLLDSEGYSQNGKEKLPSRFLKEIGEENYIRIGNISKELQDEMDRLADDLSDAPIQDSIAIGEEVTHPAFGVGKIIDYGKNNSYIVKFEKLSSERVLSKDFFNKARTLPKVSLQSDETTDNSLEGYEAVDEQTVPEYIEKKSNSQQGSYEEENPVQSPDLSECENLWKREDVPKEGWFCVGVTDLGAPVGVCQMCGHQIIRYVHHMCHLHYHSLTDLLHHH